MVPAPRLSILWACPSTIEGDSGDWHSDPVACRCPNISSRFTLWNTFTVARLP